MYVRTAVVTFLFGLAAFFPWGATRAQDSQPIWSGVFTAEQAERGRAVTLGHCVECHGDDLGGGEAPALVGSTFMTKWETHSVDRLYQKIRDTMPSRGSTAVTNKEKLDAVAYILQQNGYPTGSTELKDSAPAFAAIRLVPKGGSAVPRSGALVQTAGCLQEAGPGKWTLSESTDPQVTTLDPMTAEDRSAMAAAGAGTQTIELLSVFPSPVKLRQTKVLVKGLFIKTETSTRINVTVLEPLSPSCQ